ncbi:MAG: tetratricopeptide repeat protein [Prochloraceae cyanobacterium]|nr:tetratricopeptide repeat protein [Prochloraceae cyanobacterium]
MNSTGNKKIKITWNTGYFSKDSTTEIPTEIITPTKVERLFLKPNIPITYQVNDLGPYILHGELPSGQNIGKSLILTDNQTDGEIVIDDSEPLPSQTMNLHKFFGTYPEKSSDRNQSSNLDRDFWLRLWSFETSQKTKWKANNLKDPKLKRYQDSTLIFIEKFPSNSPCYLEMGQPGYLSQFVAIPPASKVQAIVRRSSNPNMKAVNGGLSIKIISLEPKHDLAQSVLAYFKQASFKEVKDLVIKMRENQVNDNNFDPFIAAVTGYFLLKIRRKDLIMKMAKNFYQTVDWLPDSALIYAWYLIDSKDVDQLDSESLESHIAEIKDVLVKAVARGLPLFSIGLRFLFEKLRQIEINVPSDSPQKNQFSNVIKELGKRLAACDENQPMTTFFGVNPWRPTLDTQLTLPANNCFYVKSKSDIFNKERIIQELARALPFSIGLHEPIEDENIEEIKKLTEQLEKLIEDNPELDFNAFDYETLGDGIFLQGDYQRALDYFDKAINIDERICEVFYSKGVTLGRLEEHKEALNCFEKAIEIDREHVKSWIGKAVALYKLGKCDRAIECCDEALKIEPKSYRAWNNKGVFFLQSEEYPEAISCFEKALDIKPTFANAFYNMACSYALQKEDEKAIEFLEKTIDIDPNFREIAKMDEDFDNLQNNEQFRKLIHPRNSESSAESLPRLSNSGGGYLPYVGVVSSKSDEHVLVAT